MSSSVRTGILMAEVRNIHLPNYCHCQLRILDNPTSIRARLSRETEKSGPKPRMTALARASSKLPDQTKSLKALQVCTKRLTLSVLVLLLCNVWFEALIAVLWDVTPCSLVDGYHAGIKYLICHIPTVSNLNAIKSSFSDTTEC
jgi:hypothetical protein